MSSKIHSQGKVPFSWENKPGVSKEVARQHDHDHDHDHDHGHDVEPTPKLPPPPCPPENARVPFHDLQIPLPPCPFQPAAPSRSSSRKGLKKIDDPFLIAYKEVTKSNKKSKGLGGSKGDQGFGLMKNMAIFSCKQSSCGVAEDSVVRLSQLPISRSHKGFQS
ncbi:hypothetical protein Salat_1170900 [Sesamum alatum]|uniref:Uncharacterized protein n=1 Tax=Sesamum alatum TaxID=300844 RepID=A0AAE1YEC6_9LAMI|nr:hypothetical protein Salat_1170900 [Sesamum alatum]